MVAIGIAACGCLQLLQSWTCLSTCRAEGGWIQAHAKLDVILSACRAELWWIQLLGGWTGFSVFHCAERGCVEAVAKSDKLWTALEWNPCW